jgi:DNA-binding transcriptional LysR family regulator
MPPNSCLASSSVGALYWNFVEDGKRVKVPINGSLIVNDIEAWLHAVLPGVGFARLATLLVMSYIEKGEMETALDEYSDERPGLMLYYRAGASRSQSFARLPASRKGECGATS